MKVKKKIRGMAKSALGGLVSMGVRAYQDNKTFGITECTVELPTLPPAFDRYRIAHLSDLHSKVYGGDNFALMQAVDYFDPDIVVMTGDMVSRGEDGTFRPLLAIAEHFAGKFPVYYAAGNHELDYAPAVLDKLWQALRALGVKVLLNETVTLEKDGAEIDLSGLCLPMKYYRRGNPLTPAVLRRLLGKPDPARFQLLLAHNPLCFEAYAEWGADLTLSGHLHGGGIRLPAVGGVFSPDLTFFPEYTAGVYRHEDKRMVVSRGLGGKKVDVRLNNQAELLWVRLRRRVEPDKAKPASRTDGK